MAAKDSGPMVRKSREKAIAAVAHETSRSIDILLPRREPSIDPRIVCAAIAARKNAPRRIGQPEAIGKWPAARAPAANAAT